MPSPFEVNVVIKIPTESRKMLRALVCIVETMDDLCEDFAYREDVREAAKAVKYLISQLNVELKE
jgi:hypothetical protein